MDKVWGLHTVAPLYYPELITTGRTTTEEDIREILKFDHIGSVKDSFAALQLEPFGFRMLFGAEWICHPPINKQECEPQQWSLIRTEEEFERWPKMTGLEKSIPFDLLGNQAIKIFYMDHPDGFTGFIANVAADVVGISNVYSSGMDGAYLWRTIPR